MNTRRRQLASTPERGHERCDTFKRVLGRYKDAMDKAFYLEAITLMESLISDRLESYMSRNIADNDYSFSTLERLIRGLRRIETTSMPVDSIEAWKQQRNILLHEMAKIEEGNYEPFDVKYKRAKQCAEDGLELFRVIDKICRKSNSI